MLSRILLFICILIISVFSLEAQNKGKKEDVQKQRTETTKKLQETSRQLEENKSETNKTLKKLMRVEEEISELDILIKKEQISLDSLDKVIKLTQDSICKLSENLKVLSDKYIATLRHHQQNGHYDSPLSYIFAAENFRQALRRYRNLKQFAKWRTVKAHEIDMLKVSLEQKESNLSSLKRQQETRISELENKKERLTETKSLNDKLIASLKKKGNEIKKIMTQKQKELQALDKELEKLIAEEQARIERERKLAEERRKAAEAESIRIAEERKLLEAKRLEEEKQLAEKIKKEKEKEKKKQSKKVDKKEQKNKSTEQNEKVLEVSPSSPKSTVSNALTSRSAVQISQGFRSAKGSLPYPIDGKPRVIRHFGRQKHPQLPLIETDNPGIDILVKEGELVRAIYEGTVSAVFKQPGYNNIVMIRHGDYLTIYANLLTIDVHRDQRVAPGQSLGTVAVDGDDEEGRAVLHFEIRHEKDKENPENWLKK